MKYYIKIFKMGIGAFLAIYLAEKFNLLYATSAGVITILTLLDTKKETVLIAFKRIVAFIIATLIAYILFNYISYTAFSFGVFLIFFAGICLKFNMPQAIPMNSVLISHYLLNKSMPFDIIANESFLLIIGVGIGILFNLYIPGNVHEIRKKQYEIEEGLKKVLFAMARNLRKMNDFEGIKELEELNKYIDKGIDKAYTNMNNTFFQESRYFIEYMEMRKRQYFVLNEILEKIGKLSIRTIQSEKIADFVETIADSLSESQNTRGLIKMQEELLLEFKKSELPKSREEFENRAILYVLIINLNIFLNIKKNFVDSLSLEQKKKYWDKE